MCIVLFAKNASRISAAVRSGKQSADPPLTLRARSRLCNAILVPHFEVRQEGHAPPPVLCLQGDVKKIGLAMTETRKELNKLCADQVQLYKCLSSP